MTQNVKKTARHALLIVDVQGLRFVIRAHAVPHIAKTKSAALMVVEAAVATVCQASHV